MGLLGVIGGDDESLVEGLVRERRDANRTGDAREFLYGFEMGEMFLVGSQRRR